MPPANNLIISGTSIRSLRHLEHQNPSIISRRYRQSNLDVKFVTEGRTKEQNGTDTLVLYRIQTSEASLSESRFVFTCVFSALSDVQTSAVMISDYAKPSVSIRNVLGPVNRLGEVYGTGTIQERIQ